MTNQEITEAAARKVMGWHGILFPNAWYWSSKSSELQILQRDFDPLHNIAHAWLLAEKVQEKGYYFFLKSSPGIDPEAKAWWTCEIYHRDRQEGFADGPAAPAAITRAAVAACGKENDATDR